MKRVDIKITYQCNNRCVFCVQGDKREYAQIKSVAEIEKAMQESFTSGIRGVVLTGGEPTLHPDFLEILSIARNIGFEEIHIQTNGRRFAYLDFCIKAIKSGALQFMPSLHGHNAEIHDFLAGAKGSFDQTVQGIKNLNKLNQYVVTNTVITSKNYKYLDKITNLLVELDVDHIHLSFPHILGSAAKNRKWLIPQKSIVMPYIKNALENGIKAKKKVSIESITYCFMIGYEKYISEEMDTDTRIYDSGLAVESYKYYRKNEGKIKGLKCAKCKYYEICEGPWKEYVDLFGWDEFKPILSDKKTK